MTRTTPQSSRRHTYTPIMPRRELMTRASHEFQFISVNRPHDHTPTLLLDDILLTPSVDITVPHGLSTHARSPRGKVRPRPAADRPDTGMPSPASLILCRRNRISPDFRRFAIISPDAFYRHFYQEPSPLTLPARADIAGRSHFRSESADMSAPVLQNVDYMARRVRKPRRGVATHSRHHYYAEATYWKHGRRLMDAQV